MTFACLQCNFLSCTFSAKNSESQACTIDCKSSVFFFFLNSNFYLNIPRWKFPAFIKSSIILVNKLRNLQEQFTKSEGKEHTAVGLRIRSVGRRALDLVDEAFTNDWRQSSGCQVESSSLTIKIPAQSSV